MDAGASEDKANKASEELVGTRVGRMEGKLTLLLWAVGVNVAATMAVFGILVPISRQLGEISAQLARLIH
jgi:hypothetical protein